MTKMQRFDINCETGEQKLIDLTLEEIEQAQRDVIARELAAEKKAEEDAAKAALEALKASAKAKLIAGTPLTAEEADTLVL